MAEIKGYCKDCYYAKKIGEYRYECPFRKGLQLVIPEGYCEQWQQKNIWVQEIGNEQDRT